MSKDNKTIEILQKNLDEDMAWRIKELSILKTKIPRQKGTEQDVLIRAGITTLYAHWEGFIKYAAECYLQFVSLRKLNDHQLDYCFVALSSRKSINELIKTNKFKLQKEMIKNLLDNLENTASIPHENIINTKSNLNFEVFTDICTILGIDDSDYQLRQKAIDEQLLTQRNKIAHGKYLTIDYEEYISIYNLVIELIRNFKDDLLNAAVTEQYKKVKSI